MATIVLLLGAGCTNSDGRIPTRSPTPAVAPPVRTAPTAPTAPADSIQLKAPGGLVTVNTNASALFPKLPPNAAGVRAGESYTLSGPTWICPSIASTRMFIEQIKVNPPRPGESGVYSGPPIFRYSNAALPRAYADCLELGAYGLRSRTMDYPNVRIVEATRRWETPGSPPLDAVRAAPLVVYPTTPEYTGFLAWAK